MAVAIGAISRLLSNVFNFDTVAIFTQDFKQVFKNARAIKATVKEEAKVMEHPLETGATIVDHRIILPVEIELSMILSPADYKNTYNQIKDFYINATLLLVQTKSGTYANQLIQSIPHEETPETYNTLVMSLNLKQAQFVTAQFTNTPKNPSNGSNVSRGTQQGTNADAVKPSILSKAIPS